METVVHKDARELPRVTILEIIQVDARIVVLHVHQIASKLVLKPVRMAARTVLLKVRDVRTVVPLVHHLVMIPVKIQRLRVLIAHLVVPLALVHAIQLVADLVLIDVQPYVVVSATALVAELVVRHV